MGDEGGMVWGASIVVSCSCCGGLDGGGGCGRFGGAGGRVGGSQFIWPPP